MNIIVTGGAGFIGSHTVVELLGGGYDVVVVDNYSNSKPCVNDRVRKITGRDFKVYDCDMCNPAALDAVFAAEHIDAVIHFAGLKAVGESVAQPVRYYRNNLDSTLNLISSMKKYGVGTVVFSSSATVYGSPKSVPIREDFPLSTTNPYGETKLMIERILDDCRKAGDIASVSILRYFNPIGAHESGMIGEDPKGIPNNLVPYIAKVAVGKLEKVHVYGNDYPTPDGTGVRDYIHVSDLADAHIAALKYLDRDERKYDAFNVGTGEGTSVRQIVDEVKKVTGLPFKETVMGRRAGDPPHLIGSPKRINEEMGWHAKYNVEDIVKSAWDAWQANPEHHIDVDTWKQTD